jgi:hypothetical protein
MRDAAPKLAVIGGGMPFGGGDRAAHRAESAPVTRAGNGARRRSAPHDVVDRERLAPIRYAPIRLRCGMPHAVHCASSHLASLVAGDAPFPQKVLCGLGRARVVG